MKTTNLLAAVLVCALAFMSAQAQQVPIPTTAAEVPGPAPGTAGDPETKSAEELAKETQNPIANLISVPFQNNFNFLALMTSHSGS